MKSIKRLVLSAIAVTVALVFVIASGYMYVLADDASCEITVKYYYGENPLANAAFSLYRVGSENGGVVVLEGDYENYPIALDLDVSEGSSAADLAMTLYGYTALDGIDADYKIVTNENGIAKAENIEKGVYLMVGEKLTVDGETFVTDPQLVILPWRASADAEWDHSVTVEPKYSRLPEDGNTLSVKVLKKWDDNGNEDTRPENIKIHLLCDGELYETVELTAGNSWRHTWDELDATAVWTVVEEPVATYKVINHREGVTRVITNSKDTPPPPPPQEDDKLPQTGMLLWPIPVLALGGISMIIAGIATMKGKRNEA